MIEKSDGRTLEIHLSRKLTRADFMEFIPVAERFITDWGKFGVVVVMRDFEGCEVGALWEDMKWDTKHYDDVERVALVGEKKWQAGMSKFCRPFSGAEIKYFDVRDINQARLWVEEALAVPA
jgi:hypothetical protein